MASPGCETVFSCTSDLRASALANSTLTTNNSSDRCVDPGYLDMLNPVPTRDILASVRRPRLCIRFSKEINEAGQPTA